MEENEKTKKGKNMSKKSLVLGIVSLVLQVLCSFVLIFFSGTGLLLKILELGGRSFDNIIIMLFGLLVIGIIISTIIEIIAIIMGVLSKKYQNKGNNHIRRNNLWKFRNCYNYCEYIYYSLACHRGNV